MAEISELEQRLLAAMDRIGGAVDAIGAVTGPDPAEHEALREELEAERVVTAQLEERIKALRAQAEEQEQAVVDTAELAALRVEVEALRQETQDTKAQNRTLRQSVQRLQASLQNLRQAGEDQVEPHAINQAMLSELEGLKASRDADRAELEEILGALKPMLEETVNA